MSAAAIIPTPSAASAASAIPNVKPFQPHNFVRTFARGAIDGFDAALSATQKAVEAHEGWVAELRKNPGPDGFKPEWIHRHSVIVYQQREQQVAGNAEIINRIRQILSHKSGILKPFDQRGAETQAQLRHLDLEREFRAKQVEAQADIEALEARLPHIAEANSRLAALNAEAYAVLNRICSELLAKKALYTTAQAWTPSFLDKYDYVTTFKQRFDEGAFNVPSTPAPQPLSSAPAAAPATPAEPTPMAAAKPAAASAPSAAPATAGSIPAPTAVPAPAPVVTPIVGIPPATTSAAPSRTPQNTARADIPSTGTPQPKPPVPSVPDMKYQETSDGPRISPITISTIQAEISSAKKHKFQQFKQRDTSEFEGRLATWQKQLNEMPETTKKAIAWQKAFSDLQALGARFHIEKPQ